MKDAFKIFSTMMTNNISVFLNYMVYAVSVYLKVIFVPRRSVVMSEMLMRSSSVSSTTSVRLMLIWWMVLEGRKVGETLTVLMINPAIVLYRHQFIKAQSV